jgi:hypothetical protein
LKGGKLDEESDDEVRYRGEGPARMVARGEWKSARVKDERTKYAR